MNQQSNNKFNSKSLGFGLLEVLISVGILALVTGGVIGLGNISVKNSIISADRTVAYNLAQEGKEALKQIRDTKWVDGLPNADHPWNENFDPDDGKYYIDADADGKFILTNVAGTGIDKNNTNYIRSIVFSAPDDAAQQNLSVNGIDNINVTEPNQWMVKAIITVAWREYDRDWTVELPVYFTDWMPY